MAVAACVLVVFGAKLWLVTAYGSPTPVGDQWDGEATTLYDPYLSGQLSLSALFEPHNEHRIFFTRLLALGLLEFSGQWDVILQMVANAALHTSFMAVLLYLLRDLTPGRTGIVLCLFTALVFAIPFGWENTLAGFQSEFYLILLFSCFSFVLTLHAPAFTWLWGFGVSLSVASFFCIASGALTPIAAAAVAGLQIMLGQRRRHKLEFAGIAVQLVLAGVMLKGVPHIEGHDVLRAHSISEYLYALQSSLSWPLRSSMLTPFFLNAPLMILIIRVIREPRAATTSIWFCFAVGLWVIAQNASLSYGRAAGVDGSRYLDLKTVGLVINFAILLFLIQNTTLQGRRAVVMGVSLSALWIVNVCSSLGTTALHRLPAEITGRGESGRANTANLSLYLKTNDISVLRDKPLLDVPFPSIDFLANAVALPTIRGILPAELLQDRSANTAMRRTLVTKGIFRHIARALHKKAISSGPKMVFVGIGLLFTVGLLAACASPRPAKRF